mmetsp:Transcript_1248/g.2696  ORF Transcript_1248/g.2696 Transcript_1248/m.2696 type:complete len:665 (-) Transcript_1248:35-2029(-)
MSGARDMAIANSVVDLVTLRDQSRSELAECINKMKGPKALVLDPSLSGPLGLIAEKQLLKEHGVEKTYHLRTEPFETDQRRVMFLVRDKIWNMKAIAKQVRFNQNNRQKLEYCVIVVPRRTIICERVLEEEGVYNDVQLGEFDLGLIPCEDDVISMEYPDALRECLCDGDFSSLFYAARCIRKLESRFGIIPTIKGKGASAKKVADIIVRLRKEVPEDNKGEGEEQQIDELILVDRESDLVTPMLTQLTYEGLIDDIFGISNGIVELPSELISSAPQVGDKKAKVKVQFNSSDQLFALLRDANFEQVGSIVKKRATFLKAVQDEKDSLQGKSVTEIKEYVRKLKEINIQQEKNLLSLHTSIALEIKSLVTSCLFSRRLEIEQGILQGRIGPDRAVEFIQHLLCRKEPFLKTLRLLCLSSLIFNGIKRLETLKTEFIQVYGFEVMQTLEKLEKVNLIKKAESTSSIAAAAANISAATAGISVAQLTNKLTQSTGWEGMKKKLKLVVETEDDSFNDDIAYCYSGYAPISSRIAENALFPPGGDWTAAEEMFSLIPGPLFEHVQPSLPTAATVTTPPKTAARAANTRHVALIFFVGGATCAEVSSIRHLARQQTRGSAGNISRHYIVGTTKLISGDSLLGTFHDLLPTPARAGSAQTSRHHSSILRV